MAKILLAEDDPMIAEIYQKKFEAAGFEVGTVVTGKEVLSVARKTAFDLVLLDLILPEMNGIDVLREIKQSGKYPPAMKVVIFSNMNDKEERDKAFAGGADGFILKSQYSPTETVEEVKRMLSDYQEQEKNEMRRKENGTTAVQANPEENEESRKKILFIEDEEIFLEMFGKKLEDEGYEVVTATNGTWGVKEALAKNFDLIIMDMVMTAMSGDEIIERLKIENKTKNIPIIALSATLDDSQLATLTEKGVNDYFIKTRITPSDLAKRVKEILGN